LEQTFFVQLHLPFRQSLASTVDIRFTFYVLIDYFFMVVVVVVVVKIGNHEQPEGLIVRRMTSYLLHPSLPSAAH